jgi:hypothetical protein
MDKTKVAFLTARDPGGEIRGVTALSNSGEVCDWSRAEGSAKAHRPEKPGEREPNPVGAGGCCRGINPAVSFSHRNPHFRAAVRVAAQVVRPIGFGEAVKDLKRVMMDLRRNLCASEHARRQDLNAVLVRGGGGLSRGMVNAPSATADWNLDIHVVHGTTRRRGCRSRG